MELRQPSPDGNLLSQYRALFAACFPDAAHLNETYLSWLYGANPSGHVIGFDAWDGDILAAHYVLRACGSHAARKAVARTAITEHCHRADTPGKGLFTKLANATYERGAELGFYAIYGVANANSTPGFVKKLGFELLTPLDAAVGVGRLPLTSVSAAREASEFNREWNQASLEWRSRNPARPYQQVKSGDRICAKQLPDDWN